MLSKENFNRAKQIEYELDLLRSIEHGMDSPHVETTVGLVDINPAVKREVHPSMHALELHNHFSEIETKLKAFCATLLDAERQRLTAELSKFICSNEEPNK